MAAPPRRRFAAPLPAPRRPFPKRWSDWAPRPSRRRAHHVVNADYLREYHVGAVQRGAMVTARSGRFRAAPVWRNPHCGIKIRPQIKPIRGALLRRPKRPQKGREEVDDSSPGGGAVGAGTVKRALPQLLSRAGRV